MLTDTPIMKTLKLLVPLTFLLLIHSSAFSQRDRPLLGIVGTRYSGEAIDTYDLRDKDATKGSFYWSDEWHTGAILTIDNKNLEGLPVKYDLLTQNLEIKTEDDIKAIPTDFVKEFVIVAKLSETLPVRTYRFIRVDMHFDPEYNDPSFYVLVHEGKKLNLLLRYETEVLKPNYVAILDAGSVQSQILKKEKFMVYDGENVMEMPKKKKQAIALLSAYKADVGDYIKAEKINLKNWDDLVKLFTYCES